MKSILLATALCRGDRIRTCDHLVPNQARYRTALRPESAAKLQNISISCNTRASRENSMKLLEGAGRFDIKGQNYAAGAAQKMKKKLEKGRLYAVLIVAATVLVCLNFGR